MSARLKVTYVTQWFAPEPTLIPDEIAQAIAGCGCEVVVLTGIPNYPTGIVHPGYSAARVGRESVRGLRVLRAPLYPSHDNNTAKRIANYLSWAVSATFVGKRALKSADVNVVYASPITAALPAMVAHRLHHRPYVLIIQDVWPDSVFATGHLESGWLYRLAHAGLSAFCRRAYSSASRVVAISPEMADLLAERGVDRRKLEVIYNWVDEDEGVSSAAGEAAQLRERLRIPGADRVFMYAGNHGSAQALSAVVDAFALFSREEPAVHLVLVGDGVEKPTLIARARGVPRVHFVEPQPRVEMPRVMSGADVQIVSLSADPLFAVTMPSKLQSVMAVGQPVLAVASGTVARTVEEGGFGLSASPGDVHGILAAMRELAFLDRRALRALGMNGKSYYGRTMSREHGAARYHATLQAAAREN